MALNPFKPAGTAARPPSLLEGAAPSAPRPSRRKPAHYPVQEGGHRPVIIFLTVCTHARRSMLAHPDTVAVLRRAWTMAQRWSVGRWVVMPNHVHLFCSPATNPTEALTSWIRYWKSEASRHWPRPSVLPLWQRDYWDTQLRTGDSYALKWDYVRRNPVREGLVERPEDWPYQGEENVLTWLD